ncbi:hypothetical protein [Meiothermus granaticius]|uniref:Uncharacterized protein n=1 Tax=Meiothermus granaticius NBRC 107808 TaxID=1227551 RepID=A0A399F6N2_9DEIN|nr:hypothetical protein [Meiothermus granaticius]RIH91770.1 hypothetical protein Mgrana_02347 [Meiothermus granaticius NBRC 107808]GEM88106.1 hypothetical protein MGR01S_27310 [Meiothermus granaticius NBRC 107808]
MASEPKGSLTPEGVAQLAQWAGLRLDLDRAAELIPLLEPLLEGDARIARLELGLTPILGPTWAGAEEG